MSENLVTVGTHLTAHEADLAKLHLEQAGIRACVENADNVFADALANVAVMVAEEDAPRATELLEEMSHELVFEDEASEAEETACFECGAVLAAGETKCPQCGWTYTPREAAEV